MGDKLVPLDLDNGGKHWAMLAQLWNQRIGSFDIVDGQYYWSAEDPSSLEAIKQIKTLYDDGLLAMDSYNDSNNAGRERFLAGRSAVLYGNLGATILQTTARTSRPMSKASPKKTSASSASKRPTARSMSARSTSGGLRSPSPRLPRRSHGSLAGGRQLAARTGTD